MCSENLSQCEVEKVGSCMVGSCLLPLEAVYRGVESDILVYRDPVGKMDVEVILLDGVEDIYGLSAFRDDLNCRSCFCIFPMLLFLPAEYCFQYFNYQPYQQKEDDCRNSEETENQISVIPGIPLRIGNTAQGEFQFLIRQSFQFLMIPLLCFLK